MALRKDKIQLELEVNGKKAGTTYNQIQQNVRDLNREITKLEPGTEAFRKKAEELQAARKRFNQVKDEIAGIDRSLFGVIKTTFTWQNAMKGISTILPALAGAQIFAKAVEFFTGSSAAARDFEAALSSLSSLTGATGEDLEFYKEQAAQIGLTTTLSASQAVDAFKLIGSARPELLKDKEALAAVTREAITLAEAAGIDLPTAAQSLAGALNQFQLPSEDAARVINALAAGSKEGAAAIPDITAGLDKFGTAANGFNVTIEESVGLVETLAEFNLKGAESGTALRNVLSRMQNVKALPKAALDELEKYGVNLDIVSDKNLTLEQRLQEFSKIGEDSTAIMRIFGLENAVAGQIVLQNVDKFAAYTSAVTDTTVAVDQARINTDNMEGDMKALGSATEALKIGLGELINAGLRPLVQGTTTLLQILVKIPEFVKENKVEFIALGVAIVALNGAQIAASASALALAGKQKILAIATRTTAIANAALNAVLHANPISLIIAAVAALVIGMVQLYKRSETVRAGIAGLGAVAKEVFIIIKEAIAGFAEAWDQLKSGDIGGALKTVGKSIVKFNPVGLALTEGKRLKNAFLQGYDDKKASDAAEREAKELAAKADAFTAAGKEAGQAAGSGIIDGLEEELDGGAENTLASFKEKLTALKKELAKTDIKSVRFTELTTEIAKIEAQIKALSGKAKGASKSQEDKAKKDAAKLQEDLLRSRLVALDIGNQKEALLLDKYRIEGLITQEQYDAETKAKRYEALEDQLAILREFGKADTAEYEKIKIEKLKLDNEYAQKAKDDDEKAPERRIEKLRKEAVDEEIVLKEKFASLVIAEQEYNAMLSAMRIENYQLQLDALKAAGLTETETYKQILQSQLDEQIRVNQTKVENAKRTADLQSELDNVRLGVATSAIDAGIELLGKDEKARKENGTAIKAFESARVLAGMYSEIQGYFASMAKFGPVGVALAKGMSILAGIRAFSAINKIRAQKFNQGGRVQDLPVYSSRSGRITGIPNIAPTPEGDNMLAYVKVGETILNDDQVAALGGARTMRRIRVPGYASGGIALPGSDANTTPSGSSYSFEAQSSSEMTKLISAVMEVKSAIANLPRVQKAVVVYRDIQEIASDVESVINKSSI